MIAILDNGHGGIIGGKFVTPGKRSPINAYPTPMAEGEFNRAIVARIIERLSYVGIPYYVLTPEIRDVSLHTRVNRVNYNTLGWGNYNIDNCYVVSIHSNAGGGTGNEIWTSKGETLSDRIATVFGNYCKDAFPEVRFRADYTDGDLDKESNFYILRNTKCPAILTENFFMDRPKDLGYIRTRQGRDSIAQWHYLAIKKIYEYGIK